MLRVVGPFVACLVVGVCLGWFLHGLAEAPDFGQENELRAGLWQREQELQEWRSGRRRW